MRDAFRKGRSVEADLSDDEEAEERGPLICESDCFATFYQLEKGRAERNGMASMLVSMSVLKPDRTIPLRETLERASPALEEALTESLRRGDVLARWNSAQFLILLTGLSIEDAEAVVKRVCKVFKGKYGLDDVIVASEGRLLPFKGCYKDDLL